MNKKIAQKIKYAFLDFYNKYGFTGIFVLIIIILYLLSFFISPTKTKIAIIKAINTLKAWWWILIVVWLLMCLTDLIFNKNIMQKLEGSEFVLWLIAIFGGIISTGPIYMWYPLLKDLHKRGFRIRHIVAFLYNRSIKPALIVPMIAVFGVKVVSVLLITMIVFSIINGVLVEEIIKKQELKKSIKN